MTIGSNTVMIGSGVAAGIHFMRDLDAKRLRPIPTAVGTIARLAYERTKEAGVDLVPLLKKAGLTHHQIEDPNVRLQVRDQIHFLNLAADALEDELLGFHLAQLPDLRELGHLYYVSASSQLLSLALQRIARYSSIINEGVTIKYIENNDVVIGFDYAGVRRHKDRHQIEFFMTFLVRLCRQLTGRHVVPSRVSFSHWRNESRSEFVEFFGTDVEFGDIFDEVTFAAAIKRAAIASVDPYLNNILIAEFDAAVSSRPTTRGSFQSSVENAIVPFLPHGNVRLSEVAHRLGVSQRSLARRLSLEGRTFSDVLESLRSDLAQRYLKQQDLSISQIAWLLGYREVSALTHAFKRWTGNTPREARSRAAVS